MLLQNGVNGKTIEIDFAKSFFSRLKGLMFKKNITKGIFFKENSVHMLFMFEPIDIIMLDKKDNIIKLYPYAKPWLFARIIPKCKIIIELPKGSIEKMGITKDSELLFKINKIK